MSDWRTLVDYVLLKPIIGQRTQVLVAVAFVLNFVCYWDLPAAQTNFWKFAVQQVLILTLGTLAAKLDRLRP